jgi:hypothetical protein
VGFDGSRSNLFEYTLGDPLSFRDDDGENLLLAGAIVATGVVVYLILDDLFDFGDACSEACEQKFPDCPAEANRCTQRCFDPALQGVPSALPGSDISNGVTTIIDAVDD